MQLGILFFEIYVCAESCNKQENQYLDMTMNGPATLTSKKYFNHYTTKNKIDLHSVPIATAIKKLSV